MIKYKNGGSLPGSPSPVEGWQPVEVTHDQIHELWFMAASPRSVEVWQPLAGSHASLDVRNIIKYNNMLPNSVEYCGILQNHNHKL